ncbi:MAG: hypothetical protein QM831_42890 [Kofleriaceae bacterium]
MPNPPEIWQAGGVFSDFRVRESIEPDHGASHSDQACAATRGGARAVIKYITPPWPVREAAQRAFGEVIDVVRTLTSPHVIPVIDHGLDDNGTLYYAMDWINGETALARLKRGRVHNAAYTARVLQDLWRAIAAAGDLRVDIHPRHTMLSADGARIWNLGIAGWSHESHALVAGEYTNVGTVIWHGNLTRDEAMGRPWTPANTSAQIALLAFNLLTATWYWEQDNTRDHAMEMLMAIVRDQTPPPSARTTHALPAGFDAWFARCLAGGYADPQDAIADFPAS